LAALARAHRDGGKPSVGVAAREAEHARRVRPDPQRRRLPLVERRREERSPQAPERAVEVDRLAPALPQAPDDGEGLLEARDALPERHAVGLRVLALAVADADDRAP